MHWVADLQVREIYLLILALSRPNVLSVISGAGWGGCTVSLVLEDNVENFIQNIRNSYKPYANLDQEALAEAIFATKPGPGACGMSCKIFITSSNLSDNA